MSESTRPTSTRRSRITLVDRLATYGPVALTVAVLIVQTFFPSLADKLPITAALAIISGGVVFLVWRAESVLTDASESTGRLEKRVQSLEATQRAFIESSTTLSQAPLGKTFAAVAKDTPRFGELRIYAISSQQILTFFRFNNLVVERCQLLVRAFGADEEAHRAFANQIKLVLEDWRQLQRDGRIGELEIRHYDFFPTEYECIFDRSHLILGLYDSAPDDYSKVRVRDPILVRADSEAGRTMIVEFADRFDRLFATCANHHRPIAID